MITKFSWDKPIFCSTRPVDEFFQEATLSLSADEIPEEFDRHVGLVSIRRRSKYSQVLQIVPQDLLFHCSSLRDSRKAGSPVEHEDSLKAAIDLMAKSDVSVLVVKAEGLLIGILTVADVMHGFCKRQIMCSD